MIVICSPWKYLLLEYYGFFSFFFFCCMDKLKYIVIWLLCKLITDTLWVYLLCVLLHSLNPLFYISLSSSPLSLFFPLLSLSYTLMCMCVYTYVSKGISVTMCLRSLLPNHSVRWVQSADDNKELTKEKTKFKWWTWLSYSYFCH